MSLWRNEKKYQYFLLKKAHHLFNVLHPYQHYLSHIETNHFIWINEKDEKLHCNFFHACWIKYPISIPTWTTFTWYVWVGPVNNFSQFKPLSKQQQNIKLVNKSTNFIFNWKSDMILVLFIMESVFLFFHTIQTQLLNSTRKKCWALQTCY